MRRGLMQWNPQELPISVLEARITRLRAAMQSAGLDAFLIYTNLVRPGAVTHLTGFTPYWSEGLLLVPKAGRLVFATALSNRVAEWIRSTNPVSEVVSTPKPGTLLGERLAGDASVKRVGVLELDLLPSGHSDDLASAAPKVEWVDASATFAALRRHVDDAERNLLAHADALAVAALAQIDTSNAADAGTLTGLVELHARLAAAEEAYIAVAPDLGSARQLLRVSKPVPLADRFAVRASVAYKGSWVRRTRTFAEDKSTTAVDAWFKQTIGALEAGRPLAAQLAARVGALPGAELRSWLAESCLGSYPLAVVASSRSPDGVAFADQSFLVLTIELVLDGAPWIGAAPLIVGKPNG
jgi:hypothetical protein